MEWGADVFIRTYMQYNSKDSIQNERRRCGTRVFFFAVVALCWFLLSLRGPRKPVSE